MSNFHVAYCRYGAIYNGHRLQKLNSETFEDASKEAVEWIERNVPRTGSQWEYIIVDLCSSYHIHTLSK